jgi:hypothetical protein
MEYMVTDGCYRLAKAAFDAPDLRRANGSDLPHSDRVAALCKCFGLSFNDDDEATLKRMLKIRNGLFHEGLWDGSQPSTNTKEGDYRAPHFLHCLNQRLFPALFDYRNKFIGSSWRSLGPRFFDKRSSPNP